MDDKETIPKEKRICDLTGIERQQLIGIISDTLDKKNAVNIYWAIKQDRCRRFCPFCRIMSWWFSRKARPEIEAIKLQHHQQLVALSKQ